MSPEELRSLFEDPAKVRKEAFAIMREVAKLCRNEETLSTGREMVIRALEHRKAFEPMSGVIDALLRQVGLFPYANPDQLTTSDRLAYEYHRPLSDEHNRVDFVFHREQAEVYRGLMDGQSFVLSAPTSFGKSLIIDALLESGRFRNLVIIVPTIALIDETRRRLSRFSHQYKVITHPSQTASDRSIYVLTQERAVDREDLKEIDLLVIDEFYKLDVESSGDQDRAVILNQALYKLRKRAKQIYLLGPSIDAIPEGFGSKFRCTFKRTDFNTVVSEVRRVAPRPNRELAFLNIAMSLDEPTLVYCKSPRQANEVVSLLAMTLQKPLESPLEEVSNWIGEAYHPEWGYRNALRCGVGIHHGRVPRALAHLTVRLFNDRKLKFLVCTSSLIEGVNTVAKNVIIFESRIAKSHLDFFTFQNIRGRSGRMFKHFIGRVFLLDEPPTARQTTVDIPVFTQGAETPLSLLMQVDESDLNETSRQRLISINRQSDLSIETIRANSSIDPKLQVDAAREIRADLQRYHHLLGWRGYPDWNHLLATCEMIFSYFVLRPTNEIFTGRQLAFRLRQLQNSRSVQKFISEILSTDNRIETADQAVEAALQFQRNWASFAFPRYLHALDLIQQEVFSAVGMNPGDYSLYGAQVENLFLPSEIPALEEYGLPMQITLKIQSRLSLGAGLDKALDSLRTLNTRSLALSSFEREIMRDSVRSL